MKPKKRRGKKLTAEQIMRRLDEAGFILAAPKLKPAKKLNEGPTIIYPEGSKKGIKL